MLLVCIEGGGGNPILMDSFFSLSWRRCTARGEALRRNVPDRAENWNLFSVCCVLDRVPSILLAFREVQRFILDKGYARKEEGNESELFFLFVLLLGSLLLISRVKRKGRKEEERKEGRALSKC